MDIIVHIENHSSLRKQKFINHIANPLISKNIYSNKKMKDNRIETKNS